MKDVEYLWWKVCQNQIQSMMRLHAEIDNGFAEINDAKDEIRRLQEKRSKTAARLKRLRTERTA